MTTQTSLPPQEARRAQTVHKRQSIATAPAVAETGVRDRIETTLTPSGATIPVMRRSRAEQAAGSAGRSSDKHAPSSTSAGVASGSESTATPSPVELDHGGRVSPEVSKAKLQDRVNVHNIILNDQRFPGWLCALIFLAGIVLTWAAIVYAVVWALTQ